MIMGMGNLYRNSFASLSYCLLLMAIMIISISFGSGGEDVLSGNILYGAFALGPAVVAYLLERFCDGRVNKKAVFYASFVNTLIPFVFLPAMLIASKIINGNNAFDTPITRLVLVFSLACLLIIVYNVYAHIATVVKRKDLSKTAPSETSLTFLGVCLIGGAFFLQFVYSVFFIFDYAYLTANNHRTDLGPIWPLFLYMVSFFVALLLDYFNAGNKKKGKVLSLLLSVLTSLYYPAAIIPATVMNPYLYFNGLGGMLFTVSGIASFILVFLDCWIHFASALDKSTPLNDLSLSLPPVGKEKPTIVETKKKIDSNDPFDLGE